MRYYINFNNTTDNEVSCNSGGAKISYTPDSNNVYFRIKLNGTLSFSNEPSFYTYDAIYSMGDCDIANIIIKEDEIERFRGYFYKRDCKFNEDRCVVSVEPRPIDKYTYVSKIADKEFNILAPSGVYPNLLNWHIAEVINNIDYEYVTITENNKFIDIYYENSVWSYYNAAIDKYFDLEGRSPITISAYDGLNLNEGWTVIETTAAYIEGSDRRFNVTTKYAREIRTFVRPNHILSTSPPNIPEEDGWVLIPDSSKYVGQTQYDVWGRRVQGVDSTKYQWNTRSKYNLNTKCTVSLVIEVKTYYRQCILLNDVFMYILKYVDIPLTFKSEFFTSRENPISGKDLSSLGLLQKTLAADPNATDLPTKGLITLNKLLTTMANLFQVYPSINSNNEFVLEHISYYNNNLSYSNSKQVGIDLVQYPCKSIGYANKYSFATNIPIRETFAFSDASDIDFIGCDISYENCLQEGDTEQHIVDMFSTQADNVFLSSISDQDPNFMLFQMSGEIYGESKYVVQLANGSSMTVTVTGFRKVLSDTGKLSGVAKPNAHLSWANLHDSYWKENRYLPSGLMNEVETQFTQRRSKLQEGVKFSNSTFDPLKLIRTKLGDGEVTEAEYSFKDKVYTVKLKY